MGYGIGYVLYISFDFRRHNVNEKTLTSLKNTRIKVYYSYTMIVFLEYVLGVL